MPLNSQGASLASSSAKDAFSTIVLNPASVVVVLIASAVMKHKKATLSYLFNPWGVGWALWVGGYLFVRLALLGFVDGFVWMVAPMR